MADDKSNSQNSKSDPDPPQTDSEKAIAKAFIVSMSWAMAGLSDKPKPEEGDRGSKD
jgi:hypothetical protein